MLSSVGRCGLFFLVGILNLLTIAAQGMSKILIENYGPLFNQLLQPEFSSFTYTKVQCQILLALIGTELMVLVAAIFKCHS